MGDDDLTGFSKLLKNRARLKIISLEVANLQKIAKEIENKTGEKEAFNKTGIQVLLKTIKDIVEAETSENTKKTKATGKTSTAKSKTKTTKAKTTSKKTTTKKRGSSTKA